MSEARLRQAYQLGIRDRDWQPFAQAAFEHFLDPTNLGRIGRKADGATRKHARSLFPSDWEAEMSSAVNIAVAELIKRQSWDPTKGTLSGYLARWIRNKLSDARRFESKGRGEGPTKPSKTAFPEDSEPATLAIRDVRDPYVVGAGGHPMGPTDSMLDAPWDVSEKFLRKTPEVYIELRSTFSNCSDQRACDLMYLGFTGATAALSLLELHKFLAAPRQAKRDFEKERRNFRNYVHLFPVGHLTSETLVKTAVEAHKNRIRVAFTRARKARLARTTPKGSP